MTPRATINRQCGFVTFGWGRLGVMLWIDPCNWYRRIHLTRCCYTAGKESAMEIDYRATSLHLGPLLLTWSLPDRIRYGQADWWEEAP